MRPLQILFATLLLSDLASTASAQGVFLQKEGKFLYPPNLSTGDKNALLGMTIGSVPGFPVSATIDAENIRTDSHGNTVIVRYRSKIFRDSKGRTRLEWDLTPLDQTPVPGWLMVEIFDPTTSTSIHLTPSTKFASKSHFPAPGEKPQQVCKDSDLPKIDPKTLPLLPGDTTVSQIELAHDLIDGMKLRHGRESVKYSYSDAGKTRLYSTVTDYWFSQELQFFVQVKRNGPHRSQHTVKLSAISRAEPDPSLFTIPADYTVSEPQPWSPGNCSPKLML